MILFSARFGVHAHSKWWMTLVWLSSYERIALVGAEPRISEGIIPKIDIPMAVVPENFRRT